MNKFKNCKVVILSTQKAEDSLIISGNKIWTCGLKHFFTQEYLKSANAKAYHIYILSNDEIKKGDWYYDYIYKLILQATETSTHKGGNNYKKVIATTDTFLFIHQKETINVNEKIYYLPKPSIQFINKFIEEYNKGNIIKDVLVEYETKIIDYEPGFVGDINIWGDLVKVNSKDNTITIKKVKDSWNKNEHIANLVRYREDYETFKRNSHFIPNQKEIEKWSNNWIEQNL